jgi:hypothetical protein
MCANASYIRNLNDSKSITCYIIMINGAVSYHACKQGNMSLLFMEAEYIALSNIAYNFIFVDKMLSQLTMPSIYPLTLKTDV